MIRDMKTKMKRCFIVILTVWAYVLAGPFVNGAETSRRIVEDYKVIQIVSLGNAPARIGLLRSEDSKKIRTEVGKVMDGYAITGVVNSGTEVFVVCQKGGDEYLFALKRPDKHPFHEGPLLESFKAGLIRTDGKLTKQGQKTIINNLRQFASAADQYFLENGKNEVAAKALIGPGTYLNPNQIQAIAGEDYKSLHLAMSNEAITVTTVFGESVSIPF